MRLKDRIKEYQLNPNRCKYCNSVIELIGNKIAIAKVKQFCNHKCNALYQGEKNRLLGNKRVLKNPAKKYYCNCGNEKERKSIFCKKCYNDSENRFLNRTKEIVLNSYKSIEKGFIAIRKNSRYLYNNSNKPKYCTICGYDKHYEICHIKAVSEFENNTLIKEINSLNNLTALCRNHHWELDNGLLKL